MLRSTQHPDQRALWTATPTRCPTPAVEEIVRWHHRDDHFRRTATGDAVSGARRSGREKVVMFLQLGNRDERAFPIRTSSTSSALPTSTRASARADLTSASVPTSPARGSSFMFEELFVDCPTSRSRANPTTSRARSSTASSACRALAHRPRLARRVQLRRGRTMGQPVVHFEIIGTDARSSGATTATCRMGVRHERLGFGRGCPSALHGPEGNLIGVAGAGVTEASSTLSADWYFGTDRYERERSSIFASEWLVVRQ